MMYDLNAKSLEEGKHIAFWRHETASWGGENAGSSVECSGGH
jgi:hypothetical protein